jgi:hypothetical protein
MQEKMSSAPLFNLSLQRLLKFRDPQGKPISRYYLFEVVSPPVPFRD